MSRKRIWRDIRDIHLHLNYETDPEVATFVFEFGNTSLARLVRKLLYEHVVSTGHPAAKTEYCHAVRIAATMDQLGPDAQPPAASRTPGRIEAAQPAQSRSPIGGEATGRSTAPAAPVEAFEAPSIPIEVGDQPDVHHPSNASSNVVDRFLLD